MIKKMFTHFWHYTHGFLQKKLWKHWKTWTKKTGTEKKIKCLLKNFSIHYFYIYSLYLFHFLRSEKLCAAPTGRIPLHWNVLKPVLSPETITVVCCGWLWPCGSCALSRWRVLGLATCIWNQSQWSIPSASWLGLINLHRSHLGVFPAVSPELSAVEPAWNIPHSSPMVSDLDMKRPDYQSRCRCSLWPLMPIPQNQQNSPISKQQAILASKQS